jgi:ACR3 family arsenite efflux pump ArsB
MMYPVLVKVRWEDFGNLFKLRDTYTQMGFSLLANWVCYRIFFTRSESKLKL